LTHTVVEGDLPGPIKNTATANGTDPLGNNITDTAKESVSISRSLNISVIKTADPTIIYSGETVTWNITVENTGDVTLTDINVTDDNLGTITTTLTLAPGEKKYYEYTTNPTDDTTNVVIVNGTDSLGRYVTATDSASVDVITSGLSLVKTVYPTTIYAGGKVNYTYAVTNTGDNTLVDVVVEDDILGYIGTIPSIEPGETIILTKENVIINQDTLNTGSATAIDAAGHELFASDTAFVNVSTLDLPLLIIEKTDSVDPVEPTYELTYTITVRNVESVDATNVIITDLLPEEVSYLSASIMPSDIQGKVLKWNIGTLGSYDSFTLYINVKVHYGLETGTVINNTVNVTCDEGVKDRTWETTNITNVPPFTFKKFHGEVTNVSMWGIYILHYIPRDTLITLESTDYPIPGASGVNHTYYRIWRWNNDSQKWVLLFDWKYYNGEYIDLAQLGEKYGYSPYGKYEIEFYSIDKAGNRETWRWNDVYVYEE